MIDLANYSEFTIELKTNNECSIKIVSDQTKEYTMQYEIKIEGIASVDVECVTFKKYQDYEEYSEILDYYGTLTELSNNLLLTSYGAKYDIVNSQTLGYSKMYFEKV